MQKSFRNFQIVLFPVFLKVRTTTDKNVEDILENVTVQPKPKPKK